MDTAKTTEVVTTCTRDCPSACGVVATVENGRVVSLEGNPAHPVTGGHTCAKLRRYIDRVYSPHRIAHPMKKDGGGTWQQISWEDALDAVAARMTQVRNAFGPEAILYYQGFGTRTALQLLNRRFFNRLGGCTTLKGTLCGGTGEAAQNLDLGCRISHDIRDHLNSETMILWGRNPAATHQPLMPVVQQVRKNGGEAVVIDPVRTATAHGVNRHIQPAPGKDLWLALAVAKEVLKQGWEDRHFVSSYADHFEEFVALVEKWPFDTLVQAAGVDASDVRYLAERLCHGGPASILLGWGLHRWVYAHEAIRAIDALSAMTGNIGISGGGVSQGFDEWGPFDSAVAADDLAPGARQLLMPKIGEEILAASSPPIEMILVTAGNPVTMAPDSTTVKAAFERTPFVVYCGHFMDDTAATADIFLPATTWLEESDVVAGYGHDVVGPVNRAIAPVGEARSHFDIFAGLARRLGLDDFERGQDAWLETIIQPLKQKGISFSRLRSGPVRQGLPGVPYADRSFPTVSGRFQFIQTLHGVPDEKSDTHWPFALLSISPGRTLCSEWLPEDHPTLPQVILNPTAAATAGVGDGSTVFVESKKGRVLARLKEDPTQRGDVAVMPRGGWSIRRHGVNILTESLVSKVGNGTAYYETRVRVIPAR